MVPRCLAAGRKEKMAPPLLLTHTILPILPPPSTLGRWLPLVLPLLLLLLLLLVVVLLLEVLMLLPEPGKFLTFPGLDPHARAMDETSCNVATSPIKRVSGAVEEEQP